MTPTTAQAILDYVKKFNVPAKPSVDESEGVIKVWLRAIGWVQDRWGNYLEPSDPNTRYHFKKTQLNKQSKNSQGDWSNEDYKPSIDVALSLIVSAAAVAGDQETVQKYSKSRVKRKVEKKARADTEQDKRDQKQAYALALKEYAVQRRGFVKKMLLSTASEAEILKAREEFVPIREKWLAAVKAGTVPESDQQFATADSPPIIPVLGNEKYVWIETVDGVDYTVRVNTAETNVAEVSIGASGSSIGASAMTHWVRETDPNDVGDSYISGKVYLVDKKDFGAALFLITSASKQKGAGTRALAIWCRMMAGYGIKLWIAQAVGPEGLAFLQALEKKGAIKIQAARGANLVVECINAKQNPTAAPEITLQDAIKTGEMLGIEWKTSPFDAEQFRRGMVVELEHGDRGNAATNVTDDNLLLTGMITYAHLLELDTYYYLLDEMEKKGDREKKYPRTKPRVTMKAGAASDWGGGNAKPGFKIFGHDDLNRKFNIFVQDRKTAEKIRDEYKNAKPGYAYRIHELLVGKTPLKNPSPPDLQGLAKKMAPQWVKYGVVGVGTGFVLPEGGTHGQWSLYAWTRDLESSRKNIPSEVKGYPVMIRGVPRVKANPSAKTSHVLHKKVFHVGTMKGRPKRPSMSLEGSGVSVSLVPNAWVQIAELGRSQLNVMTRKDGKAGRFVDLTGNKTLALAPMALEAGYIQRSKLWRYLSTDEEGEEVFSDFPTQAEAERELEDTGDGRVEEVEGFVATPKLEKAWKKDFTGNIPDPLSIGVLYALEESTNFDGAWWNEDLDPWRLSAPRGVIFRSRLPEWTSKKIDWEKAPDADAEY